MKTLSKLAVNLCFVIMGYAQQGDLQINIEKINSLDGKIFIGIYTENNFLIQPFVSGETKVENNIATALFENLDYGTYAIAAYQDVNGNQNLDRDEYGRPTEPWVISGLQASMVPIWMDAKIDFKRKTQTIKLKL